MIATDLADCTATELIALYRARRASPVEATQAGYEVGTRTIVDVLIAQQTLFQSQSAYSQARHAFVLSGLQLKQSAGTIGVKDIESVNALLE